MSWICFHFIPPWANFQVSGPEFDQPGIQNLIFHKVWNFSNQLLIEPSSRRCVFLLLFSYNSAPTKQFMILIQTKTKRVDGHVVGDTVHVASKHHLSAISSSRSLPKLIKCESSSRRRDPGSCNIPILSHAVVVHILLGSIVSILESLLYRCKGFPCCPVLIHYVHV